MEENNRNENELSNDVQERNAGYSAGSFVAYVVAGCMCALIIGVTVKILQWMLF